MSDHWSLLLFPVWGWPAAAVWICVPLLALAVDWWLGEPRAAWHPVVWMGQALQGWGDRLAPPVPVAKDLKLFWHAALIWCALAAIVLIVAWVAQYLVLMLHVFLAAALLALLLKPLLAWRMLHDEVLAVEVALGQSLPAGRAQLARLVSRDVSVLTAVQVRESAIESLAENLNDSVVAPLFWFALLGLPGAALYRFANTADAMWGYRGHARRAVLAMGGQVGGAGGRCAVVGTRTLHGFAAVGGGQGAAAFHTGAPGAQDAIPQQRLAYGGHGTGAGRAAGQAGGVHAA